MLIWWGNFPWSCHVVHGEPVLCRWRSCIKQPAMQNYMICTSWVASSSHVCTGICRWWHHDLQDPSVPVSFSLYLWLGKEEVLQPEYQKNYLLQVSAVDTTFGTPQFREEFWPNRRCAVHRRNHGSSLISPPSCISWGLCAGITSMPATWCKFFILQLFVNLGASPKWGAFRVLKIACLPWAVYRYFLGFQTQSTQHTDLGCGV